MAAGLRYSTVVDGNGELLTNSNIVGAHEELAATGEHKYIKYIDDNEKKSRFDSIYRLNDSTVPAREETQNNSKKSKKKIDFKVNYYMISLNQPGRVQHSAEIRSNGSLCSTSIIKYGPAAASTVYILSTEGGTIDEKVISSALKGHSNTISETYTNGSMHIASNLSDDSLVAPSLSDEESMLNKLESVNMYGTVARIEKYFPKTEVTLTNDEQSVKVKDDGGIKQILENKTHNLPKVDPEFEFLNESADQLGIYSKVYESGNDVYILPPDRSEELEKRSNQTAEQIPQSPLKNETESKKVTQSNVDNNSTNAANDSIPKADEKLHITSSEASKNDSSLCNATNTDPAIADDEAQSESSKDKGVDRSFFQNGNYSKELVYEDDVYLLPPDRSEEFETEYNLSFDEDRNFYRIGGIQQRLGKAHLGRKVRGDFYFSEKKIPISKDSSNLANMTKSVVLTDAGRI